VKELVRRFFYAFVGITLAHRKILRHRGTRWWQG
jgi:hypothetical protein